MAPPITGKDVPRRHRRSSHPSWAILNRDVARRDGFLGDRTTSAISRTSCGEEISVSLHLTQPLRTSVVTLD